MNTLKLLKIILRTIFIEEIIFIISKHLPHKLFTSKKLKIVKYRMKNFKSRKKLSSHYYYH